MESIITKTLIPEAKRLDFLPSKLGKYALEFEMVVYGWMDKLCEAYKGGYWQFYALSNFGFYIAFEHEEVLRVQWPDNYSDEEMSPEAASIAANLFALNSLCWKYPSEGDFTQDYYLLREFAAQHSEGAKIMRVID